MANESLLPPEIEDYSRKLARDPKSLVFAQLAEAYRRNNMLDEAVTTCLQGLHFHPDYVTARLILGRAYRQKNIFPEAKAEFLKFLEVNPDHILVRNLLAEILVQEREYAQAKEEYEKVLAIEPENATAREGITEVNTRLATVAPAEEIPEEETPETAKVPSESAAEIPSYIPSFSLEDFSLPEKKEEGFRPSISFSEEVGEVFGETELPEKKTEVISTPPPPNEEFATLTLAEIYLNQGLRQEAIRVLHQILQEHPDNTVAQEKLEEVISQQIPEEEELIESTFTEEKATGEAPPEESKKPSEITMETTHPEEEVVAAPPSAAEDSMDRLRRWLEKLQAEQQPEEKVPVPPTTPEEKIVIPEEVQFPSPEVEMSVGKGTFAEVGAMQTSIPEIVRKVGCMEGVKATVMIGKDGEVKAQFFRAEGIPGLKGENSREILNLARQLAIQVGGTEVKYTLLETSREKIFLSSAGEDLMVVVTDPNVRLGWIRLEISRIGEQLAQMGKSGGR